MFVTLQSVTTHVSWEYTYKFYVLFWTFQLKDFLPGHNLNTCYDQRCIKYTDHRIKMCVCTSLYLPVCLFVCMLRLGERLDGFVHLFLEVVGEVKRSVSKIPNNYFDAFDVAHVKHKDIFFE